MVDSPGKGWQPWEDLPPEKEEEIIEKIAKFIVKRKLGLMAEVTLASMGPFASMFATLGMNLFGPFLEFFGIDTLTAFFRKKENFKRLTDRIEELGNEEKRKGK